MLKFLVLFLSSIILYMSNTNVAQAAEKLDNLSITINVPSRTMTLYSGDQAIKEYSVAIGKYENQTPIGDFKIRSKEINPTWIKPVKDGEESVTIESGPENPLGYRWMEFFDLYGIHGTNSPETIGKYVSNGCIRMQEKDVEEVYDLVPLGTPVHITYERIVVKKHSNQMVTLSIYPDEYQRESVNIWTINQKLNPYGMAGFLDADIISGLDKSIGQTIEVAKTFSVNISGKIINAVGVNFKGVNYLPVVPVATERKVAISWNPDVQLLMSPFGTAPGYVKNDILYINADYAYALYGVSIRFDSSMNTMYIDNYSY